MSKTVTAPRHPEDWRPELRGARETFRFRNDMWERAEDAIEDSGAASKTEWVEEAIEGRMSVVQCGRSRCGEFVPVRFGNLGGTELGPWLALARRVVAGQDCRAHEPVTVGIDT